MKFTDRIFGEVHIIEPVLLDLLDSRAVNRLDGVLQHGVTGLIGVTRATTRLEHSLGVMALVRQLGGSLREQIAALLHDVSHTAFSHVIDYVFDDHQGQGFHEEHKESFMASSDLPDILARHAYDWRDFLDEAAYPLLEQPAPALCADRLDYFLRDALDLGLASQGGIEQAVDSLEVWEGRIVCRNLEMARWMAYTFIEADQLSWANFREVGLYELAAQAIRKALQKGVIFSEDLWGIDHDLWRKLETASDPDIQDCFRLVSPDTRFVWDEKKPTFWVGTKLRTIDPPVLLHERAQPLSSLDPSFGQYRLQYLQSNSGKWPMRVINR